MHIIMTTHGPLHQNTLNYSLLRFTTSAAVQRLNFPQNQQSDRTKLRSDTLCGHNRFWATGVAAGMQLSGSLVGGVVMQGRLLALGNALGAVLDE